MAPGQRIVLDANILIRGVLGQRVKKIITDHAEHAEFFAPEVAYGEARRHLPEILAKHDRASRSSRLTQATRPRRPSTQGRRNTRRG